MDDIYKPFINYHGVKKCLRDLSELECSSNVFPGFFNKLSHVCHGLRSLKIYFYDSISNELVKFVSVQKNLKNLHLQFHFMEQSLPFTKFPNSLTRLHIDGGNFHMPWSLISELSNLQELSFYNKNSDLKDFENLQYAIFPQLEILKFECVCPEDEYLFKFLENNGKNLRKLFLCENIDGSVNSDIGTFCTNLKYLRTILPDGDVESLKVIFNGCKQLESIEILRCDCCDFFLDERKLLEIVVEFSPKFFYKLTVNLGIHVYPETTFKWELKSILKRWANREPCIPLFLKITLLSEKVIEFSNSNFRIISEYKRSGVIHDFKIINLGK
ncbi:6216_t:CDS:1 [Funneliformis geosporum]|uniref:6216_t:CDS:1 n=1 Tax=Funneliformis geosporum TaxID=1117311 RepID=A0A9W4SLQ6_9GLOM|nr:6216_t:CDS:1 [Funneliformis geosporum]